MTPTFPHCPTSFNPPPSNFNPPPSNFLLQTSNFLLQTSPFKLQTSSFKLQTSARRVGKPHSTQEFPLVDFLEVSLQTGEGLRIGGGVGYAAIRALRPAPLSSQRHYGQSEPFGQHYDCKVEIEVAHDLESAERLRASHAPWAGGWRNRRFQPQL